MGRYIFVAYHRVLVEHVVVDQPPLPVVSVRYVDGMEEALKTALNEHIFQTYLLMALFCKLHPVVWNDLVDLLVLIALRLSMANEDDQLDMFQSAWGDLSHDTYDSPAVFPS